MMMQVIIGFSPDKSLNIDFSNYWEFTAIVWLRHELQYIHFFIILYFFFQIVIKYCYYIFLLIFSVYNQFLLPI